MLVKSQIYKMSIDEIIAHNEPVPMSPLLKGKRIMKTYVAITTTNAQQNGWHEVASGTDWGEVQAEAQQIIGDAATDYGTDIYRSTEHANLIVVSKTKAKRTYGVDIGSLND